MNVIYIGLVHIHKRSYRVQGDQGDHTLRDRDVPSKQDDLLTSVRPEEAVQEIVCGFRAKFSRRAAGAFPQRFVNG